MKELTKLIFILLFIYINTLEEEADSCLGHKGVVSSYADCKDSILPEGQYRCCYVHYFSTKDGKTHEVNRCDPVTKSNYEKLAEYIEQYKKMFVITGEEVSDLNIICDLPKPPSSTSKYLKIGLFSFLALLI